MGWYNNQQYVVNFTLPLKLTVKSNAIDEICICKPVDSTSINSATRMNNVLHLSTLWFNVEFDKVSLFISGLLIWYYIEKAFQFIKDYGVNVKGIEMAPPGVHPYLGGSHKESKISQLGARL